VLPPPLPPPPLPACTLCASCQHVQLATGRIVGTYLDQAATFRKKLPVCAEVHEVNDPPGSFVLTLGQIDPASAQESLAKLRTQRLWGDRAPDLRSGRNFRRRLYPPPCDDKSLSSNQPGHECSGVAPSTALVSEDKLVWGEGQVTCECRPTSDWLIRWREFSKCRAKCEYEDRLDETACDEACAMPTD
jgi:hypothetical protein